MPKVLPRTLPSKLSDLASLIQNQGQVSYGSGRATTVYVQKN